MLVGMWNEFNPDFQEKNHLCDGQKTNRHTNTDNPISPFHVVLLVKYPTENNSHC